MSVGQAKPLQSIRSRAEEPAVAYEDYLACLHYRDHPEAVPAELAESFGLPSTYMNLSKQSHSEFGLTLRNSLSFVLSRTLAATNQPTSLFRAEERREIIPGVQLYLTNIVGHIATQRVIEEGWEKINPRLMQLRNPFENYDTLIAIWRYSNDKRQTADLGDFNVLAPGYYEKLS